MKLDIGQALTLAVEQLPGSKHDAQLEAELLLAFVLKKNRAFLHAFTEVELTHAKKEHFLAMVKQRAQGVPIAYITGIRSFWSLDLKVTPDTLIPRPETELLVELILTNLSNTKNIRVLDLGTGSGAIALAIAKERPHWIVNACDISEKALAVAQENAFSHGIFNVTFYQSNWFESIPLQPYDVIVSNPPYIDPEDAHLNQGDLRFEPLHALASDDHGLADIKIIAADAYEYLTPQGLLLIEHGYDQKIKIGAILKQTGYKNIMQWQDLQGHDRVSAGYR